MAPAAGPAAPAGDGIVWEEVACPLCGAADEEQLIAQFSETDQAVYRLVRCRACGLGYLNPRPDVASIGHFYPDDYECYQAPDRKRGVWSRLRRHCEQLALARRHGYPPALTAWPQKALATLATPLLRRGQQALTALPYLGQGRLLDFGCGSGWYAQQMRERGWTVTGLDFSEHAAREVMRHYGIPVLVGTLPHPAVAPASFDLITMGCVLEHVHEPHAVLAAAAEALAPGGALVVTVPNLDSWGFRYFGQDWWPLELPRHLLHFTPTTLRRLVNEHGLEVAEERMLPRGSWMRRSFAFYRRRRGGLSRQLLGGISRLRVLASALTKWSVAAGQSDCIMIRAHRPAAEHLQPVAPAA
jgi:SAM-dependent methyltransferase